ncbi:putative regulator of K+ conductance, cation/H+ exchanger, NAD(P)-binding domain superfamily [Helianthus annuus]|nr:putative regulator of K+ conductance, cation/H+ exchanger, NAD(P)-binding domain superfamily [Helianthus annuus]
MNLSSSFKIRGYQSINCGTFEQLNLQSSFGYSFLSNPRSVSNICSRKKLNASSNHGFNSAKIQERFNSVCILKISRGTFKTACQGNDSIPFINGNGRDVESGDTKNAESSKEETKNDSKEKGEEAEAVAVAPTLDELKELLQKAHKELEIAQLNSIMFEDKAQRISEAAIALKDKALNAWDDVNSALISIEEIVKEEGPIKEAIKRAKMALSLAEARHQVALESENGNLNSLEEEEALLAAQKDMKECSAKLEDCEKALIRLQNRKDEVQKEVVTLNDLAEKAQTDALKAEEDVANIMLLAEEAVALELEALKRVNDAEIALQKAEKVLVISLADTSKSTVSDGETLGDENTLDVNSDEVIADKDSDAAIEDPLSGPVQDNGSSFVGQMSEESRFSDDSDKGNEQTIKDTESDIEKTKNVVQTKKQETQKDFTKDSSPSSSPKALLMKSSRFLPASFFSLEGDGTEFTPAAVFQELGESVKKNLPKLLVSSLLVGASFAFYAKREERIGKIFQQPNIITTNLDEVSSNAQPLVRQIKKLPEKVKKIIEMLPHQEINEEEASLFDVLWLLLGSVIFVPIFQKLPGGSPVLGYLTAGILIGPYGLSIIRNVHATKAIAEFGVVFLLFNIGLELSVERLSSMKKYVFGLGSAQVLATAVVIGLIAHFVCGQLGPAAIVIGNGLALSSTAVVLQVLQERGESTSRHGRATFSVLLFQDLAVVVLLILIPLISPNSSKGGIGFYAIAEALGLAAVKALVAISAIIAGGRLLLRPIYKQIAEMKNAEIFSANTLLVILGTSLLTARAGLSMALGAFLAGLLLAETEFSLQVESDIAPYRGLLLGLFFMTVGMSIDPKLLVSNFPVIMGSLGLLIAGKTIMVAVVGRLFGVSLISTIRTGLLLAPGGEFAFVAFGEAVNQGIMTPQLSSLLFLVVGISMALTPWLAAGGQFIASNFDQHDVRSLLPDESETDDLQDHIIICGFGRVGQIIAQLLSERLIPFVALDVNSDRVSVGRALDLPVYFGDAGSREVLHKVGAHRACAAAITLDSPGANYRTVWALSKYFPNVKTFVRAHDVDHGINLEKAGATAVVPETLEPSLQLASAVLAQAKLPMSEIAATINEFRSRHLSELTELSETSGSSLGYGFSRIMSKPKSSADSSSDDNQISDGALAI